MTLEEKEIIKEFIENGKLDRALDSLDEFSSNNPQLNNQVAQLKARYSIIKGHELQSTLDYENISLEKNRIIKSILELLVPEREADTGKTKRERLIKKAAIAGIVFVGLFVLINYFLFQSKEKLILGKVYMVEKGVEYPVEDCKVTIENLMNNDHEGSDQNGFFNLKVEGKNKQEFEFKFFHPNFEALRYTTTIDFRSSKDTIFLKHFELKTPEPTSEFLKLRSELYKETSEVLGHLTSHDDFESELYKAKIVQFNGLYNVRMSAVETKEVAAQMVVTKRIIDRIDRVSKTENFEILKKELFVESLKLATMFNTEQ